MTASVPGSRGQTRLSINISDEAHAFLAMLVARDRITYTEAIRRALALLKLAEDTRESGGRLEIRDGSSVREVVIL